MFFSSYEEENYSPGEEEQVPTHVVERKGKGAVKPSRAVRTRKVPAKFREDYIPSISKEEEMLQQRSVVLKCSQTGKKIAARVEQLSKEDMEPLTLNDLKKGSSLIVEVDGTPYPAEFLSFSDEKQRTKENGKGTENRPDTRAPLKPVNPAKDQQCSLLRKWALINLMHFLQCDYKNVSTSEEPPSKLRKTEQGQEMEQSEFEGSPSPTTPLRTPLTSTPRPQQQQLDRIEKKLDRLLEVLGRRRTQKHSKNLSAQFDVKEEENSEDEEEFTINGVNVLQVPARDVYSFSLTLLDMLFSREELGKSLLLPTSKSSKPALEKDRVDKLFACIKRRYGTKYDIRTLTAKVNQKCRDASKGAKREDPVKLA